MPDFAHYQTAFRRVISEPDSAPLALAELETALQMDLEERDSHARTSAEQAQRIQHLQEVNSQLFLRIPQNNSTAQDNTSNPEAALSDYLAKEYNING